jgi:glycosyltransferase involved in cell wall biosynthesis
MNTICMHMPSAAGGHPLYVRELMTAMAQLPLAGVKYELVSSVNLEKQFISPLYPMHPILPGLVQKSEFRSRFTWAVSRASHYPWREWCFLKWLKTRSDITGVHFQEFNFWLPPLMRAIRRMGKKVFFTVHYIRPHAYPPIVPQAIWDQRHRLACNLCDCVFVLSSRLREELSEFLGPTHPQIAIAPHGVWTVPQSLAIPALSQRLSWKKLLFFGTMRRNKGLDLVLASMPQLADFQLTIAGAPRETDYFYNEVMPQVQRLRTGGARIDVIDRFVSEEETTSLFATHSAILLPYTKEFTAQSGVAFLALAHEIPVVCSEVGGLRDLLDDFSVGATFAQPIASNFVKAIHEIYSGEHAANLSQQIKQAKNHFSWEQAARATLGGYSHAFKEPSTEDDCCIATIPSHEHQ